MPPSAAASQASATTAASSTAVASGAEGTAGAAATSQWSGIGMAAIMMIQSIGQMIGARDQAKATRQAGDYQAQIFESNARIQQLRADYAIHQGEKKAVKAKQAAKRLVGAQRARMGAQGIDIESGSALDIQKESASLGAEEALIIRNNAWREAWGYNVQKSDYLAKAGMARITARNTAYNTILTGGANTAKNLTTAAYLGMRDKNITDYLKAGGTS